MQVVGVFHNLLVVISFSSFPLPQGVPKWGADLPVHAQCHCWATVIATATASIGSIQLYTPWAMMAVCSDEEYGPMKTELAAHSYLETYLAYGWLLHLMT